MMAVVVKAPADDAADLLERCAGKVPGADVVGDQHGARRNTGEVSLFLAEQCPARSGGRRR